MATIIKKSFIASLLISLSCIGFLVSDNIYIGAILFSFGIHGIIFLEGYLYTGIAGEGFLAIINKDYKIIKKIFYVWFFNIFFMIIIGILFRFFLKKELIKRSYKIFELKITNSFIYSFIMAIFCGIIIYIAICAIRQNIYIISVPAIIIFIISGFEHSIANIFYYTLSIASYNELYNSLIHLFIVTFGNFIGCNIIPITLYQKNRKEQ